MRHQKKEELLDKGWTEQEIKKAEAILEKADFKDVFFSKIIFWSALVVIIFANLLVSLVMIPFLIVFNQWILYLTVIVLAGVIGFLYNFLILNVGHLEKKNHLLAAIFVPLLALTNLAITVWISNRFISDLEINNPPHNIWIVGVLFAVAFILPYLTDRLRGKHLFYQGANR